MYDKGYGEKSKRNRLIVMDDISGLADTSSKVASFLTVARKFGYHLKNLYIQKKAFGRFYLKLTYLIFFQPPFL